MICNYGVVDVAVLVAVSVMSDVSAVIIVGVDASVLVAPVPKLLSVETVSVGVLEAVVSITVVVLVAKVSVMIGVLVAMTVEVL